MERELVYSSTHSSLDVIEWLGSRPSRSALTDAAAATHEGGWLGSRVGLSTSRRVFPYQESKHDFSVVRTLA